MLCAALQQRPSARAVTPELFPRPLNKELMNIPGPCATTRASLSPHPLPPLLYRYIPLSLRRCEKAGFILRGIAFIESLSYIPIIPRRFSSRAQCVISTLQDCLYIQRMQMRLSTTMFTTHTLRQKVSRQHQHRSKRGIKSQTPMAFEHGKNRCAAVL